MYIHTYTYIYVYICIYTYIYIYVVKSHPRLSIDLTYLRLSKGRQQRPSLLVWETEIQMLCLIEMYCYYYDYHIIISSMITLFDYFD